MISVEDYLSNKAYKADLINYKRRISREVRIGDTPLGGNNPIRVQSMTTADTMDTEASVNEAIRLIESGCEYVRLTAPSKKEAANLENIKNELVKRGYNTPLVADIHFTPNAAELAAKIVEKVRINPGNFADKKKFELKSYEDEEYEQEIARIRKKFVPLIDVCKQNGTAMRIGTNHGSLSDRIMSRYGDTPVGMVESAMEFLRICREENYHEIVLSMKASNPMVMVQAYRLLVAKMDEEGMDYPLHLGVTEAGDGDEGRIKSAVGIGNLLEDGIGDTVRVSLTEKSEAEIPVAAKLANRYDNRTGHEPIKMIGEPLELNLKNFHPYIFKKRIARQVENIGGEEEAIVVCDLSALDELQEFYLRSAGHHLIGENSWEKAELAADYIYTGSKIPGFKVPDDLGIIMDYQTWKQAANHKNFYPLLRIDELDAFAATYEGKAAFLRAETGELNATILDKIEDIDNIVLVLNTTHPHGMAEQREFCRYLSEYDYTFPLIFNRQYTTPDKDKYLLEASTDTGSLFIDGWGNGLMLQYYPSEETETLLKRIKDTCGAAFRILQAARARITQTEYISCPSCGRTLFDLEETTQMIREKTSHLKGVRIGVMGCIVNGPGEMADADYGYVGTGPGKITLYKGQEVVKRNIKSENALDELINLIKSDGKWVEP